MQPRLGGLRRTGIGLSLGAGAMWLVSLYGLLVAPSDGVNIGAALLGLLAMVVSVAASVVLICSLGRARAPVGAPGRAQLDTAAKVGGVLGILSILAWVAVFAVLPLPINPEPLEVAGLACFAVSSGLMARSRA